MDELVTIFLTTTVSAGDETLTVEGDVSDWMAGDKIALASTDFEHRHTEYFTIVSVNGQTVELRDLSKL